MLSSREAEEAEVERSGIFHRVYLPEGEGTKRPCVVLVHGRAGNERVMWVFSKALERLKPVVVAPRALKEDPIGGYSWWLLEHGAKELSPAPKATTLEALAEPTERLEQFVGGLEELYGVDPRRILAVGFSQGAALVGSLSLRRPELFCGVGMLAGFIPQAVARALPAEGLGALPPYFISHGTADQTIPVARAEEAHALLTSYGAEVEFHTDAVGHKVSTAGIRAFGSWCDAVLGGSNS